MSTATADKIASPAKAHGLLFKSEMVRAIGNTKPGVWPAEPTDPSLPWKWQTRRVITNQPSRSVDYENRHPDEWMRPCGRSTWEYNERIERVFDKATNTLKSERRYFLSVEEWMLQKCPHPVGTMLWVKETWQPFFRDSFIYLADAGTNHLNASSIEDAKQKWPKWRSSMLMPRIASRFELKVKRVRIERRNDISDTDSIAEGFKDREHFLDYVLKMNRHQEHENPWVYVYDFARIK